MGIKSFFKSLTKKKGKKDKFLGGKKKGEEEVELTDMYEVGKVLGSGTFATVKQITRKADNREFAVKIIDRIKLKAGWTWMCVDYLNSRH